MKRPIPYPDARRILGRVSVPYAFWLCTNQNLRSLTEIASALEKVDDDVFRYHVTRDKNDFEVWIRDVLRDKELAREIARVKTKETLVRKITERVESLAKVISRHAPPKKRKKKARKVQRKKRKISKKKKPASRKRKKPKRT